MHPLQPPSPHANYTGSFSTEEMTSVVVLSLFMAHCETWRIQAQQNEGRLLIDNLSREEQQFLFSWLSGSPEEVHFLKIRGCELNDSSAKALADALKTNTQVKTLDLSQNLITGIGAISLADMLKINSTLTTLDLSFNHIRLGGAISFADTLRVNTTLTTLSLSSNPINDEDDFYKETQLGYKLLALALERNTTLTTLDLDNITISEEYAKKIGKSLQLNKCLSNMNLTKNTFSDEALKVIVKDLSNETISSLLKLYFETVNNLSESLNEELSNDQCKRIVQNWYRVFSSTETEKVKQIQKAFMLPGGIVAEKDQLISLLKHFGFSDCQIWRKEAQKKGGKLSINLPLENQRARVLLAWLATSTKAEVLILEVSSFNSNEEFNTALADVLKTNTTLKVLKLNGMLTGSLTALAGALKVNTTLTTLNLSNNKIGNEGIKIIANNLNTNNSLITFDLSHNEIDADGIRYLADKLKKNFTLLQLDLSNNNIDDTGITWLAMLLKENTCLTKLNLSHNNFQEIGVKAIADALEINKQLTTLDLSYNRFNDRVKALAEPLKVNTSLTTLNLSNNSIGVEGLKPLADALKINTGLTTFNLSHNRIGTSKSERPPLTIPEEYLNDTQGLLPYLKAKDNEFTLSCGGNGGTFLAEALKTNVTLTDLNIRANDINTQDVIALAEALKINETLITLDLSGNSINDSSNDAGRNALAEVDKINKTVTIRLQQN